MIAKPPNALAARRPRGPGEHWPMLQMSAALAGVGGRRFDTQGASAVRSPFGAAIRLTSASVGHARCRWRDAGINLSDGRPFSVFLWARVVTDGDAAFLSQLINSPSNYSGFMLWTPGTGVVRTFVNGSTRAEATLPIGTWTHLAATWDGTTARLWVDGALGGSGACPLPASGGADLLLGGYYTNGADTGLPGPSFCGNYEVANLRIARRAAGQAEVQADRADAWRTLRPRPAAAGRAGAIGGGGGSATSRGGLFLGIGLSLCR
jgi:hypothetical protein